VKKIEVTYNRNPKTVSRIDNCIDIGITFNGDTLNTMPTPTEVYMQFTVEGGVEPTMEDLIDILGDKKYQHTFNFNIKITENNLVDTFSFIGTPILYRIPDTSVPTTEMILAVHND
jgi:hypothetical protein|tara:strand:- start:34 stop:381 length:348 start_codon:yes stop_codon:yes gene_type:complete